MTPVSAPRRPQRLGSAAPAPPAPGLSPPGAPRRARSSPQVSSRTPWWLALPGAAWLVWARVFYWCDRRPGSATVGTSTAPRPRSLPMVNQPRMAQYRALAGFLAASAVFVAIFVTLTLSAYHKPTPHDLPVGIVGSAAVTSRVEHALDRGAPGSFSFRSYRSGVSATPGIAQRQIDGALVVSGAHLRLLVTQAGGTGPEQALSGAFTAVAARSGRQILVSDVVPPGANDTEALSSFFILLSVLIPSLAGGSASALALRRAPRALAIGAPVAAAVVSGLVAAAIADGVANLGHYAALAGVVALFSLAVAAPTAVLARIWPPLSALAVLVFIVFGIPVSGGPANLASFTPGFLRVLNPVLPLGVAAGASRDVVYFAGHGADAFIWTLAAWALAGVVGLFLVMTLRRPGPVLTEPVLAEPALP